MGQHATGQERPRQEDSVPPDDGHPHGDDISLPELRSLLLPREKSVSLIATFRSPSDGSATAQLTCLNPECSGRFFTVSDIDDPLLARFFFSYETSESGEQVSHSGFCSWKCFRKQCLQILKNQTKGDIAAFGRRWTNVDGFGLRRRIIDHYLLVVSDDGYHFDLDYMQLRILVHKLQGIPQDGVPDDDEPGKREVFRTEENWGCISGIHSLECLCSEEEESKFVQNAVGQTVGRAKARIGFVELECGRTAGVKDTQRVFFKFPVLE